MELPRTWRKFAPTLFSRNSGLCFAFFHVNELRGDLLCIRLVLDRLSPNVSSPLALLGFGRTTWLLLEGTLGPISIAIALSIPFVVYGAICAVWRRKFISERLIDLTYLAVFVLAALILGNQYQ
jgi:hypothetical protein